MTTTPPVGSTFFGIDVSGFGDQLSSLRRQLSKRVLLLEFGNNFLLLSEASMTPNGLKMNRISGVQLPSDALERGVPTEPDKMAGLISEICKEKKIRAHRVAVVLPPEVGFQRLVDLPTDLSIDEARKYIQDSTNGVQIPFPLDQTDFDLAPVLSPVIARQQEGMRSFMLSAIPQQLVDRVIEMLKLADLELQLLELGSLSQLRLLVSDLTRLPQNQVDLVLELLPDSSNLLMVTSSGLLALERLSAIRDFPELNLDSDQLTTALEAGLPAESFVVQDDRYLPISDLDLRVLLFEFKKALARFFELCPGAEIRRVQLTGINSAHPMLVELMHASLGLPVEVCRPMLSIGLSEYSFDDLLVQAGLSRLIGLGLGLLSPEQLVMPLPDSANDVNVAFDQVVGIRLDQLIERKSNSISALILPGSITDVDQQENVRESSLIDQEDLLQEIDVIE
ncbi:pilus assembly protein PilM, partial [Synechococcus sp. AH-551-E02]